MNVISDFNQMRCSIASRISFEELAFMTLMHKIFIRHIKYYRIKFN